MNTLFQKQHFPNKVVYPIGYMIAGLLNTFWGFIALGRSVSVIYLIIAVLTFSLAFYPTVFAWSIVSLLALLVSAYLLFQLVSGVIGLLNGDVPIVFEYYPLLFPTFVIVVLAFTCAVIYGRPRTQTSKN